MEAEMFQKLLMKRAIEAGFSDCEVYCQSGKSFEVLVLEGEISHYENSTQRGVCFRGTYGGKMGYAFSENISEEAIDFLIREAAENAEIMEDTAREELYSGDGVYPQLRGIEKSLQTLSAEEKIAAAKEMEKAALHHDNNVAAIDYCVLSSHEEEVSIANTKGLCLSYAKNCATAYVCAIAQYKNDVKTGSEYWVDNRWENFDPVHTGQKAAKKAVSHLGAGSLKSGTYRVLLENHVAAELLSGFCGVFYGENVEKGFSLFRGRLKEKVASSKVTLRDDGLLFGATGSAPFDSEGVACQNKAVIQNGRLETFLYNLKTARAADTKSTGNGFKPSYQAPVKTACTNFYIQKGIKPPKILMMQLGEGLLITEISGLHAGANPISGDFSLSAEGFFVEHGQIKRPVEQITVAGNFYNLLKDIEEVGNDLRFSMPSSNGTMGAPMLLVKGLSVSGS